MAADSTEAPARSRPGATTLRQRGDRKRKRWRPAEAEVALQLYGSVAARGATWRRAGRCTERGVGDPIRVVSISGSKKLPVMMEPGKRSADHEQRDAKIRKLTEEFEENDTEHGECDAKIKERDRKITKLAAEIRRLTALLGERDVRLRKLTGELAKRDATIRIFTLELGQQNTKIGELTADVGECNRKLRRHAAELAERDEKIWENEAEIRCLTELLGDRDLEIRNQDCVIRKLREELAELKYREAGKEEEKIADVTLDAGTAHPRLLLSRDLRSVRWEFGADAPPAGPERFDADPCVLGRQSFASGRHAWTVDLTRGQFCAVGVAKESRPRKGPGAFTPEGGVWAVQRWGFKSRALTDPPVLLDLPRVPKKIRICLNYEVGEVAFFDAENHAPIFRFPPAAFAGERLRPWFWVEFGSVSLVRP